MNLIDKTYFILDIALPDSKYSDLDTAISRYSKKCLIDYLGYPLASLAIAYDSLTTTNPIKSLVEGAEFTVGDVTKKWNGLINEDKESLLAYYVYYYYRRDTATFTSRAGEKKGMTENSGNAEYGMKIHRAWLNFIEQYNTMCEYIDTVDELKEMFEYKQPGSINSFDL